MLYMIPAWLIVGLAIWVIVEVVSRYDDRERADELIAGTRNQTPEDIDKCITNLETRNRWLLSKNKTDRRRVELLRRLRNNKVTPSP
ncbi:unnamed protein product [marine sediment metagenome]|uniref:Uncharacterized protein n=1 Tax=marine sediment metagenome TaxID=412755 RepID=X1Q6F1_9ZZZZ